MCPWSSSKLPVKPHTLAKEHALFNCSVALPVERLVPFQIKVFWAQAISSPLHRISFQSLDLFLSPSVNLRNLSLELPFPLSNTRIIQFWELTPMWSLGFKVPFVMYKIFSFFPLNYLERSLACIFLKPEKNFPIYFV